MEQLKGYFTGVTNRTCEIDGTAVTDGGSHLRQGLTQMQNQP